MEDERRTKLFEEMWAKRKRTWDEIARVERRRERDAIFRTLENGKGDNDDEGTD